jgi:hypothetical protein
MKTGKRPLADLNKTLRELPLAERIAREVKAARDAGLTVTAADLAAIASPATQRTALPVSIPGRVEADFLALGIDTDQPDLEARGSLKKTFAGLGAIDPGRLAAIREGVKALSETGPLAGKADLAADLQHDLDLLALRGGHADLLKEADAAFDRAFFAGLKAKPGKTPGGQAGD